MYIDFASVHGMHIGPVYVHKMMICAHSGLGSVSHGLIRKDLQANFSIEFTPGDCKYLDRYPDTKSS